MVIGIIGAMDAEVAALKQKMNIESTEVISGIEFCKGALCGKSVVVAKCGVGKVFAAICAQTMILRFGTTHLINTGVGGALDPKLDLLDLVVSDKVVQHDMDTSPLGDPVGLVSGINKVYFEASPLLLDAAKRAADTAGVPCFTGTIASGDQFVADSNTKAEIVKRFGARICEMEGAAIGHVCYVNGVDFLIVRAVSDSANENSVMDFPQLVSRAAVISSNLVEAIVAGV
ncbi:MAG: 5'-methylthioadenosine/adenosylhomocysteine nucleosidase [Clostridia bacterium]|nr:5'-methylthioadenosine/adenosylhomocysteine nucleosidase [Clostridia bacterium]